VVVTFLRRVLWRRVAAWRTGERHAMWKT